MTGHNAADCTDARKIYDDNVEALDADVAWVKLIDADKEKDIEGFKKVGRHTTVGTCVY